jgi:glycosyltransferase involved in cell wall biosynthesis
MWRKSLHDRFGFFDPVFTSAGDYEFWLRISADARFLHLPETLGLYLDHAASIEHSAPLVSQQEAEAARKKHWPKDWGRRPPPNGTFFQPVTMADGAPPRPRVEIVKDSPLVSVIIPTCSRPATLPEAVRSVLAQTMRDFEILVVNDAGPDVSDLLRSLGQPEKIVSLRQETKRERSAARNLGLSRARGQFIAYLDDDDIYYPDHLEKLCAAVHLTGAKVAYADSLCASPVSETSHLWRREPFLSVDFDRKKLLASNYIPILCLLHARKCLEAAGAFDEQLNSHEDWEFFIRLSRHFDFVHVKKVTCEFRSRVETEAGRRGRHKELLRTAELVYERNRMYVGADSDVIKNQQAYLDGLKEKCKPIPSDGMPWVKYRLARPFHNLRHSLRKRLAKKT